MINTTIVGRSRKMYGVLLNYSSVFEPLKEETTDVGERRSRVRKQNPIGKVYNRDRG